ncbi:DUF1707 domain-containing protein [Pseudonocardia sp. RS010]|uniref:DUF1707 SHOCT-like domain-containing protein n=1 Tax=Pseudonocardia sp. RS010 TaxID=3385979 RepID=UPI0039A0A8D4
MNSPARPASPEPDPSAAVLADDTPTVEVPTGRHARPDPTVRIRASDLERERVVVRLHRAVGEGRLDLAEADERLTAVYAARHRDELDPLLADLPAVEATDDAAPWSAIWESVVWRTRTAVWGPGTSRPTVEHCHVAVGVAAGALLWFLFCAVLGAAAVAS